MKFVSALLLCCGMTAAAQTSGHVSCKANKTPPSDAQTLHEQGETKKASTLFESEVALAPADDRLRSQRILHLMDRGDAEEALKQANAFVAEKPESSVAQQTLAETTMRDGRLPEAYAIAARAQKMDACNARVYLALAVYENMIAMHATAKRHLDLAHSLDPLDAEITVNWIQAQPKEERKVAWAKFVETSKSLTDKQRESAKRRIAANEKKSEHDECKLESPLRETVVPFSAIRYSPDSDPEYGLELSFNGKKRRLELDTGASGLTLTSTAAERLGLVTEESGYLGGVGDEGYRRTRVTHVAHLDIGDLHFSNCTVEILPPVKDAVWGGYDFSPMRSIDGLIGGDIFAQFLLTLDYPAGELKVSPLPQRKDGETTEASLNTVGGDSGPRMTASGDGVPIDRYRSPDMQDWTQFYRIGHFLLVPTQLNDGPVKLMMADTGAGLNLISPKAARLVTKVNSTDRITIGGISGNVKNSYVTERLVLHFGSLFLPMNNMVSIDTTDLSNSAGVEVAGFLGFPALKQMTLQIDYRDSLIHLQYDPKRKTNPKFLPNKLP